MNRHLYISNKFVTYIILIIVIVIFAKAITNFVDTSSETDTSVIEDSIDSALMQCYALEGAYPSDLHHLQDYGIWFNEEDYYYYYEYIDGGIMPMVEVVYKPKPHN